MSDHNDHDDRDDEHDHDAELPENGDLYGVLAGKYDTPGELKEAARKVKDAGYTDFDCYSPFPVHGIDEAMGIKRTILPVLIFHGWVHGARRRLVPRVGGATPYNWPWNIAGKPTWSIPANIPIGFETMTILLSVFRVVLRHVGPQQAAAGVAPAVPVGSVQQGHRRQLLPRDRGEGSPVRRRGDGQAPQGRRRARGRERLPRPGSGEEEAAEVDLRVHRLVDGVSRSCRSSSPRRLAATRSRPSRTSTSSRTWISSRSTSPTTRWTCSPTERENRGEIDGTVSRDPASLKEDEQFYYGLDQGKWMTGFPAQVTVDQRLMDLAGATASTSTARRVTGPTARAWARCRRAWRRAAGRGPCAT